MESEDKTVKPRGHWGNQLEFILTCLGYAVGLGNVWRFPYLCGRSGGAAFLIPYLIMMVFAGLPVFYMELALGQYAQLSPALLYPRMAPIAMGLGLCSVMAQVYTAIYYNMVIAWAMHYLFNTFRNPLRWSHCSNDFNTFRCFDDVMQKQCRKTNSTYYMGGCYNETQALLIQRQIGEHWNISVKEKYPNETIAEEYRDNFTSLFEASAEQTGNLSLGMISDIFNLTGRRSPTYEYLDIRVLNLSKGIDPEQFGTPRWELVLCLLAAWFLVFFCVVRGIKTSGKVVYFTATFPYVILTILLFRGVSLGAGVLDGLKFYLVPKVHLLKSPKVWGDAANQIFFSLSLGNAGLTTIASYNQFHNNLFRDTLIVVLGNCATSLFAGFAIFPMVGFIAKELHRNVEDVAADGVRLAFQVYPHAINQMKAPQLWSFLFFFMLVLLGIDTQMVAIETIVTAVTDCFPSFRAPKRKLLVLASFCTLGFVFGTALTTPGGSYLLSLLDTYGGGWPVVIAAASELIFVMHIYGIRNFIADVRLMLGKPPSKVYRIMGYPVNPYWIANWVVITPILLWGIVLSNFIQLKRSKSGSYVYPIIYDIVGWMISLSCILPIPILAIREAVRNKREGKSWRNLLLPTPEWGPGDSSVKAHPHKSLWNTTVSPSDTSVPELRGYSNTMTLETIQKPESGTEISQDYVPKRLAESNASTDPQGKW